MIDTALPLLVGIASAIVGNKAASKIPGSPLIRNLVLLGGGVALAIFFRRKPVIAGAGAGLAITGGVRMVTNAVPSLAGDDELTGDEQYAYSQGVQSAMAGEMDGDMDGDELYGPLAGPLNGPFAGAFNGPLNGPFAGPSI